MSKVRFHLDECMPTLIATGLRQRKHDCTTSAETELLSASDPQQLAFARRENRVIVTSDQDFLRIADDGEEHAGIVFWTQKTTRFQLIKDLGQLGFRRTPKDLKNTVMYL